MKSLKRLKRKMSENELRNAIKERIEWQGGKCYRINNIGVWNAQKKAYYFHGAKGVPDLIAFFKGKTIFIETKSKGKATQEQEEFIRLANQHQSLGVIVYSLEEWEEYEKTL
jgi:hypothetical protein